MTPARAASARATVLAVAFASVAAALAGPAVAQSPHGPAFASCLAAHATLDGYVEGFEADGWILVQDEARDSALLGPAEVYHRARLFPPPETSLAELEDTLAEVREWSRDQFADAAVLTRDEAAVVVQLLTHNLPTQVLCIVAAAVLPETDTFLARGAPSRFGGIAMASFEPPEPPGITDLRIDALRIHREVNPPEPLPGTEAMIVSFTLVEGG